MARKPERSNSSPKSSTSSNTANLSPKRSTVAALLYIEAGLVLALGVWLVVLGFTHEEKELPPLIGVVVFAILGAIGLFASARGYVRERVSEDPPPSWPT